MRGVLRHSGMHLLQVPIQTDGLHMRSAVEATDRIAETAMAHGVILLRCRLVFVRFAAVSYPHDGSYKRFSTV